jgi:hypothetical protein
MNTNDFLGRRRGGGGRSPEQEWGVRAREPPQSMWNQGGNGVMASENRLERLRCRRVVLGQNSHI